MRSSWSNSGGLVGQLLQPDALVHTPRSGSSFPGWLSATKLVVAIMRTDTALSWVARPAKSRKRARKAGAAETDDDNNNTNET